MIKDLQEYRVKGKNCVIIIINFIKIFYINSILFIRLKGAVTRFRDKRNKK